MLFNSLSFLLLFLPCALLGYYVATLAGRRWAMAWLILVSFVFYTWWNAALAFLLAGSILFNFSCGVLILRATGRERRQQVLLWLGIAGDLVLLIYYKYFFGLLNWLGYHHLFALSHVYAVVLPLGISFFTFTQIGYLVDCWSGVVEESRFLDYSLFVTFFPHLIAGPILHHSEMLPQFANPANFRLRTENMAVGGVLFLIGLAKKLLFADQLIWMVKLGFDVPHPSLITAWSSALAYSLQLYFDFSGYSDMACGLALLFGMKFPANFNSPYRAASIIDYWQRFHMTLTRYITLFVFTPIVTQISRRRAAKRKIIGPKAIATPGGFLSLIVLPTFCTMALAGVWHGAGLTFLVFGLLHAVYLSVNHAWRSFGPRLPNKPSHPAMRLFAGFGSVALTYLAVLLAQVVFRSSSLHVAFGFYAGMAGLNGTGSYQAGGTDAVLIPLLFAIVWTMPNSLQILDRFKPTLSRIQTTSPITFTFRPTIAWGVSVGALAAILLLVVNGTTEFLYFRF